MRATPRPPDGVKTDQTAQLGGTDSIDPSADKPRVFDYEEVLTQTQIDTLEEKTKAIAEKVQHRRRHHHD